MCSLAPELLNDQIIRKLRSCNQLQQKHIIAHNSSQVVFLIEMRDVSIQYYFPSLWKMNDEVWASYNFHRTIKVQTSNRQGGTELIQAQASVQAKSLDFKAWFEMSIQVLCQQVFPNRHWSNLLTWYLNKGDWKKEIIYPVEKWR